MIGPDNNLDKSMAVGEAAANFNSGANRQPAVREAHTTSLTAAEVINDAMRAIWETPQGKATVAAGALLAASSVPGAAQAAENFFSNQPKVETPKPMGPAILTLTPEATPTPHVPTNTPGAELPIATPEATADVVETTSIDGIGGYIFSDKAIEAILSGKNKEINELAKKSLDTVGINIQINTEQKLQEFRGILERGDDTNTALSVLNRDVVEPLNSVSPGAARTEVFIMKLKDGRYRARPYVRILQDLSIDFQASANTTSETVKSVPAGSILWIGEGQNFKQQTYLIKPENKHTSITFVNFDDGHQDSTKDHLTTTGKSEEYKIPSRQSILAAKVFTDANNAQGITAYHDGIDQLPLLEEALVSDADLAKMDLRIANQKVPEFTRPQPILFMEEQPVEGGNPGVSVAEVSKEIIDSVPAKMVIADKEGKRITYNKADFDVKKLETGEIVATDKETGETVLRYVENLEIGNNWTVVTDRNSEDSIIPIWLEMSTELTSLKGLNELEKAVEQKVRVAVQTEKEKPNTVGNISFHNGESFVSTDLDQANLQFGFGGELYQNGVLSEAYEGKAPETGEQTVETALVYLGSLELKTNDYAFVRQQIAEGKVEIKLPDGTKWNLKNGLRMVFRRSLSQNEINQFDGTSEKPVSYSPLHPEFSIDQSGALIISNMGLHTDSVTANQKLIAALSEISVNSYGQDAKEMPESGTVIDLKLLEILISFDEEFNQVVPFTAAATRTLTDFSQGSQVVPSFGIPLS